ncbi:MAG: glycosyltransferase family 9 protein [Candidatus Coatesbacteria bacterium]|nr:glycosyltransferase family 9 protein [Candidatus Coatesbacteria bacterium]
MTRYIYQRRILRVLAASFDTIFGGFFRLFNRSAPLDAKEIPENPKIVFIRLDGIGDVLASLKAARALKARFPAGHLSTLVRRQVAELIDGLDFIDEVLTTDIDLYVSKPSMLKSMRYTKQISSLLKKTGTDIAIDPRGDPRIIWAMWRARVPVRIGVNSAGAGFLLSASVDYLRQTPEFEHNLLVAALLGAEDDGTPLSLKPNQSTFAALKERFEGLDEPFFVVHPSASMPSKIWPNDRFAEVIEVIAEKYGFLPVLIGGSDAAEIYNAISEQSESRMLNLTGKTSLKELVALLSEAKLFIGNDSGPAHIAAYTGIPTVIIFSGTNDAAVWRPPGDNVAVISHDVDCAPCERRECPEPKCLLEINTDEVVEAANSILELARTT